MMTNRQDGIVGGVVVIVTAGTATAVAVAHSNELGPILAFIGVILVALLTAYFTQRRQADQLSAERERLATQLGHERAEADLADLRVVLEDSLAAVDLARQGLLDAWLSGSGADGSLLANVNIQVGRLHVRLGKDDPIVKAFQTMGDVLFAIHRQPPPSPMPTTAAALIKSVPELTVWGRAYAEYIQLAESRVGSRTRADSAAG
jgi:hypothetical protein